MTVEAYFHFDVPEQRRQELVQHWSLSTDVEESSPFTAFIHSSNTEWIKEYVESDPDVAMVDWEPAYD